MVACIFDELAYWRSDFSTNPDLEVYRAVRPSMATMPGALLIGISSPYRRSGLLWRKFQRHWAKPGDVLVVKAPTEVLNPEIDRQIVADAYEDDPDAAAAEWGAEFRGDLSDFVRREVVERLVAEGVYERPPAGGVRYHGFVDPSGGSSDSFTLAIGHREDEVAVLDCVREVRAPFGPEQVVREFSGVLRSYGLSRVTGDRYAGEWPSEAFERCGVRYEASARTKSEIYLEALPLLNGARVDLLDSERLVMQICTLERRVTRGGRDTVDHPSRGQDDLANAALGVLVLCRQPLALGPQVGLAKIQVGGLAAVLDPRDKFPWTVERWRR